MTPRPPDAARAVAEMDAPLNRLDDAIETLWHVFEQGAGPDAAFDPALHKVMSCAMAIAGPALKQLREHWHAAFEATKEAPPASDRPKVADMEDALSTVRRIGNALDYLADGIRATDSEQVADAVDQLAFDLQAASRALDETFTAITSGGRT